MLLLLCAWFSVYWFEFDSNNTKYLNDAVEYIETNIIQWDYGKREMVYSILDRLEEQYTLQRDVSIVWYLKESIAPSFDSCWWLAAYKAYDWFAFLDSRLTQLPEISYRTEEFLEWCLSNNWEHFIMIENNNWYQYWSLIYFNTKNKKIKRLWDRFKSFWKRHWSYIELDIGWLWDIRLWSGWMSKTGRFYYMDDIVIMDKVCYFGQMYKNDIIIDIPEWETICEELNQKLLMKEVE